MYVCNYRGVGLFYRCGGWSGKSPQFAWMSHVSPGHVCPVVGPASARIPGWGCGSPQSASLGTRGLGIHLHARQSRA